MFDKIYSACSGIFSLCSGGGVVTYVLGGLLLSAFLSSVTLGYLYKGALERISELKIALELEAQNTQTLKIALEKQNKALKELEVKKTHLNLDRIENIVLSDPSCESELKAYKKLFKELGKP